MRYKMIALILAMTVASWAQTATQASPNAPHQSTTQAEKNKCSCCDKMAAAEPKDAHSCCMQPASHQMDGKGMASCCSRKEAKSCCGDDAKSCMKDDKDKASCCAGCDKGKTAATCCGDKCGKDCEKDCQKQGCCKKTETGAKELLQRRAS